MAEIVNLDNERLLNSYKKILTEKKDSKEDTISNIIMTATKRVPDIKSLSDLKIWLKDLSPLRYAAPNRYEQVKKINLSALCISVTLKDTPQGRSDLLNELIKIEKAVAEEVSPILGINELDQTAVDKFRERYVLDYTNGRIIDLEQDELFTTIEGFRLLHSDQRIQEGRKDIGIPEYLLKYSLLKCVDGYTNDPQQPAPLVIRSNTMKDTYVFNNWKGIRQEILSASKLDSPDKHCPNIYNHIQGRITQSELLLNWMAHMVQKPWEKPGWAVVLRGREGSGKDIIARFLGRMFHHSHWSELSNAEFSNPKETGWKKGKVIVNVTEFMGVTEKNSAHIYPIIEADEARIREMFMQAYTSKDIARFILTTNRENVIPAKMDTRRFFIPDFDDCMGYNLEDPDDIVESKNQYWDKIYKELGGKDNRSPPGYGVIALYQLLMARDISKFDIKHPRLVTQAIDSLVEINRSTLDIMIEDIIYNGRIPDYNDMAIMPPISFNLNSENVIEASVIQTNYKVLFNRTMKEGGNCYPPVGRFSPHFIKGLGLPYEEGSQYKNNRRHLKIMKNNNLHYILPSLNVLRDLYFKMHPNRKRPAE